MARSKGMRCSHPSSSSPLRGNGQGIRWCEELAHRAVCATLACAIWPSSTKAAGLDFQLSMSCETSEAPFWSSLSNAPAPTRMWAHSACPCMVARRSAERPKWSRWPMSAPRRISSCRISSFPSRAAQATARLEARASSSASASSSCSHCSANLKRLHCMARSNAVPKPADSSSSYSAARGAPACTRRSTSLTPCCRMAVLRGPCNS
mmetsp:Transcript_81397/g.263621  ORF Transcript_81397/g.263621 Transcript_81397/m.263621 type:complete len:207 (-) Transcript_81397:143-763(-)